jgi:hypothetical protein
MANLEAIEKNNETEGGQRSGEPAKVLASSASGK